MHSIFGILGLHSTLTLVPGHTTRHGTRSGAPPPRSHSPLPGSPRLKGYQDQELDDDNNAANEDSHPREDAPDPHAPAPHSSSSFSFLHEPSHRDPAIPSVVVGYRLGLVFLVSVAEVRVVVPSSIVSVAADAVLLAGGGVGLGWHATAQRFRSRRPWVWRMGIVAAFLWASFYASHAHGAWGRSPDDPRTVVVRTAAMLASLGYFVLHGLERSNVFFVATAGMFNMFILALSGIIRYDQTLLAAWPVSLFVVGVFAVPGGARVGVVSGAP
jgi:hypothetical protein